MIVAHLTLYHWLAMEIDQWSMVPISNDNILCDFCYGNVVENEAHFMLKCPLYM